MGLIRFRFLFQDYSYKSLAGQLGGCVGGEVEDEVITRRAEITGRCDYAVFGFFDHGVRPPVSRR